MRVGPVTSLVGAASILLFTCTQLFRYHNRAILSTKNRPGILQSLGEDRDWDVQKWSKNHLHAVSADLVDRRSVKNIWHSKSEAWSGIDRILPTGGGFGYQNNHILNGKSSLVAANVSGILTLLPQMSFVR